MTEHGKGRGPWWVENVVGGGPFCFDQRGPFAEETFQKWEAVNFVGSSYPICVCLRVYLFIFFVLLLVSYKRCAYFFLFGILVEFWV